jgi:hypothetical protein
MYENNYETLNLITTAIGRNLYDRVSQLETDHDVWFKLCNTYEGSFCNTPCYGYPNYLLITFIRGLIVH